MKLTKEEKKKILEKLGELENRIQRDMKNHWQLRRDIVEALYYGE